MAVWRLVLYDLAGNALGEIANAQDRRFSFPLNNLPTASFTLALHNPMANYVVSPDLSDPPNNPGDVVLVAWRDSTCMFVGDLVNAEETTAGDGGPSIACTFAGPLWRLQKRLTGKNQEQSGVEFTNLPRDLVIYRMLYDTNQERDTGISLPGGAVIPQDIPTTLSKVTYTAKFKSVAEVITELAPNQTWNYFVPATPTSFDSFGAHAEGNMTNLGRILAFPTSPTQAWVGAGGASDFHTTAPSDGTVYRTEVNDGANTTDGRFAWPGGTSITGPVHVSADMRFYLSSGDSHVIGGVTARQDATRSNYVRAVIDFVGNQNSSDPIYQWYLSLHKVQGGGAPTTLKYMALPNSEVGNDWHTIALQISSDGTYYVFYGTQGAPTLRLFGKDADLAVGGSMQSGTCGIYDWCHEAGGAPIWNWIDDPAMGPIPGLSGYYGYHWGPDGYYLTPPYFGGWQGWGGAQNQIHDYGNGIRDWQIFRMDSAGSPYSHYVVYTHRQFYRVTGYGPQLGQARSYDNFLAGVPDAPQFGYPFDFEITPQAPNAGKIGTMNVYQHLGSIKPDVVFDALKGYRRVIDRNGLLTRAYVFGEPLVTAEDTVAQAGRGLYEEVIPEQESLPPILRQSLGEVHVGVRQKARQVITFEPAPGGPQFPTDYIVGDTVTARYAYHGIVRFNGQFRVYGVEVGLDANGMETVVPTVVVP